MEKESVTSEQPIMDENFHKDSGKMDCVDCKVGNARDVINNKLQQQLEEIRQDILELVDNQMKNLITEVVQRVGQAVSNDPGDLGDSMTYRNRTKPTEKNTLPTKQFLQRNSVLTDLYEIKHIRTIYNLSVSALIILLVHTAVYDIRNTGSPNFAQETIKCGFGKFSTVLCIWILMKASTFGIYSAFCCWATYRSEFTPKSTARKLWDYAWLAALILYQLVFFVLPAKAVISYNLPIASSMIVLMEQLRLIMKTHAFVRSVAPRFLSYKPHSETPAPKPPGFSTYLYFLFAPTLIYQDSYPRSKDIRWNVVLINFAEVLTIIFFVGFIYERLLYPIYRDFGKEPIELGMFSLNILGSMLPGIVLFVCGFYCLLHCWMNAFAELLRFADKMFYKDWWTSTGYSAYYRTWNIVVHDWLYTYIYKDMYEIVTPGNRKLSVCMVFVVSAIFHEYILCFSGRFFYPVLLLMFGGIGLSVVFVLKRAGNVFLWLGLCMGSGILVSLYCMEYFARINCPRYRDDFLDYVVPRTWTCIFMRDA